MSFMSEQGSDESDTQPPGAHCPEIHTLLSSRTFCDGTLGEAPSLLRRRQDDKGHHLQRVHGRPRAPHRTLPCDFEKDQGPAGPCLPRAPLLAAHGPQLSTGPPLPPAALPPTELGGHRHPRSKRPKLIALPRDLRTSLSSSVVPKGQLWPPVTPLHTPATGPILPRPSLPTKLLFSFLDSGQPPPSRGAARGHSEVLTHSHAPVSHPASYEFPEDWSGPLAP